MNSLSTKFSSLNNVDKVLVVVLTVSILFVVYRYATGKCGSSEGFAKTSGSKSDSKYGSGSNSYSPTASPSVTMPSDYANGSIVINPPYNNVDTRTVMAGSGFIAPEVIIPPWDSGNDATNSLVDGLDDGKNGDAGLHYNICSPSCCSAQYPTPHKLVADPLVCGHEADFVPTSITCNNSWNNSGCACVTKSQAEFLGNRGGNT